jgi:D-alanine-D-alanine ligase
LEFKKGIIKVQKKELKNKKIGVLMGGLSSEREVSLKTGEAVSTALKQAGYKVITIDVGRDVGQKLVAEQIDIAFIALHGKYGEDGIIQGILEFLNIPYTGSSVLASSLAMDKSVSKEIFEYHRIPTPSFEVVTKEWLKTKETAILIKPPMIVKPVSGGSTIGVTIIRDEKDLEEGIKEALKWDNKALIERFVEGTLIAVGVLGNKPLPIVEIVPKSGFYDFKSKYTSGETDYFVPARFNEEKTRQCQMIALDCHRALRCSGATRTDIIVDLEGTPYVLEVNTIPGMTETSLLPKAAKNAGISFIELIEIILIDGLDRYCAQTDSTV